MLQKAQRADMGSRGLAGQLGGICRIVEDYDSCFG